MCINSFNICNQDFQCIGTGIYLAASILDHSCEPNAVAIFEGTTLNIRTTKPLEGLDFSKVTKIIELLNLNRGVFIAYCVVLGTRIADGGASRACETHTF